MGKRTFGGMPVSASSGGRFDLSASEASGKNRLMPSGSCEAVMLLPYDFGTITGAVCECECTYVNCRNK